MKTQLHNRIFSILLAVAMLVSFLPIGMVGASAEAATVSFALESYDFLAVGETYTPAYTAESEVTFSSDNEDIVSVDETTGELTGGNTSGTATITATAADGTSDTLSVTVTSNIYFDYMKFKLFNAEVSDASRLLTYFTEANADTDAMRYMSATDMGSTIKSFGWMPGSVTTTGKRENWTWSSSATNHGPYFNGLAGDYVTMIIDVPAAGTYSVVSDQSLWGNANNSTYDIYIAPEADADNVISDEYKVSRAPICQQGSTLFHNQVYAGEYTFEKGKYVVAYRVVYPGGGYFISGLALYADDTNVTAPTSLTITADTAPLEIGDTIAVTATALPASTQRFVEYSSSDESIAKVNESGVVTAIGMGTATITASAGSKEATCTVTVSGKTYNYLFGSLVETDLVNGTAYKSEDYADSLAIPGCAPFRYITSNGYGHVGKATYGTFFFSSAQSTSGYTQFEVELEEGIYSATTIINAYGSSSPAKVYLAPVDSTSIEIEDNLIMYINDGDNRSSVKKVFQVGTETVAVEGGKYHLFFRQTPDPNESETEEADTKDDDRYLCLDTFSLHKISDDIKIERFDLTADKLVAVDSSINVSLTNVLPAFRLDDTIVSWTSSDETIATVENGVVTGVSAGTVTISAEVDGLTNSIDILVYDKLYDYKFDELGKALCAKDSVDVVTFDTYDDGAFKKDYTASQQIENLGSAEFMVNATNDNHIFNVYSSSHTNKVYGMFLFGVARVGPYVQFKVKLDGGEYLAELTQRYYGSSTKADIYLAPTDAANPMADDYLILPVETAHTIGTDATDIGTSTLTYPAGEYLLTFKSRGTALYLCVKDFRLYRVGAYETTPVEGIAIAATNSNYLPLDSTMTLSAAVIPATATNQNISWSSSDPEIATVDGGVITPKKAGLVTITVTSEDGGFTDSRDILVGNAAYTWKFFEPIRAAHASDSANWDLPVGTTITCEGYEPWTYVEGNSMARFHPTLATSHPGLFIFDLYHDRSLYTARFKITVPADGYYAGVVVNTMYGGSCGADFYIAPTSAPNPSADIYKIVSIEDPSTGSPTEHQHKTKAVHLAAGEYYLTMHTPDTIVGRYFVIKDFSLVKVGDFVPTYAESIEIRDASGAVINDQFVLANGATTLTAPISPIAVSDPSVKWESSDETIATVDGGVITPVSSGIITVTATSGDGKVTDSVKVLVSSDLSYSYKIEADMSTLYNTSNKANVNAPNTAFGHSYAASQNAGKGSDPWMYISSDMGSGKEYFDYTNSSYGAWGVFGVNSTSTGSWSRIKINVDADGVYAGALTVTDWYQSFDFDIYVAPAHANDPVAAEYKVGSFAPSNLVSSAGQSEDDVLLSAMDMPAGDYYVTFVTTKRNNNGVLIAIVDLDLYKTGSLSSAALSASDLGLTLTDGASIRTGAKQGLRFVAQVDKTKGNYERITDMGILLLPAASLKDGDELTIAYENNNHKVARVPARLFRTDNDTLREFTGVLYNIPTSAYTTAIAARAYVIYTDADGVERVAYSDVVCKRSIYQIAQLIDASETAKELEKEAAATIIDAVEAMNGGNAGGAEAEPEA